MPLPAVRGRHRPLTAEDFNQLRFRARRKTARRLACLSPSRITSSLPSSTRPSLDLSHVASVKWGQSRVSRRASPGPNE